MRRTLPSPRKSSGRFHDRKWHDQSMKEPVRARAPRFILSVPSHFQTFDRKFFAFQLFNGM